MNTRDVKKAINKGLPPSPLANERKNKPFTTQKEMLELYQDPQGGLCTPLTNVFAKSFIEGEISPIFLERVELAYYLAIFEENRVGKMLEQKQDGFHLAFVDYQISHRHALVNKNIMTDKKLFGKFFKPIQYAFMTYPCLNNQDHMVFLGKVKNSNNTYSFFDSNLTGGVRTGSLENISTLAADRLQKSYTRENKEAFIGFTLQSEGEEKMKEEDSKHFSSSPRASL